MSKANTTSNEPEWLSNSTENETPEWLRDSTAPPFDEDKDALSDYSPDEGQDTRKLEAINKEHDKYKAGLLYPYHVFGSTVANYIKEASSTGLNPCALSNAILPVLASSVGNKRTFKVTPYHKEAPIFWALTIIPSGYSKSPVLKAATWPLTEIDKENYEAWTNAIESAEFPNTVKRPEVNVTTNATVEGLIKQLEINVNGVLISADELMTFMESLGAYKKNKGLDEGIFLELFNGGAIQNTRSGAHSNIRVDDVQVCIYAGSQPGKAKEIFANTRESSGFAFRWLISRPKNLLTSRLSNELQLKQDTPHRANYGRLISNLRNLPEQSITANKEALLKLEWYDGKLADKADSTKVDSERAAINKQKIYILRFALLLSQVRAADNNNLDHGFIIEEDVKGAIELAKYYERQQNEFLEDIEATELTEDTANWTNEEKKEFVYTLIRKNQMENKTQLAKDLRMSRVTLNKWEKDFSGTVR